VSQLSLYSRAEGGDFVLATPALGTCGRGCELLRGRGLTAPVRT
jgi:hypothetical protein